MESKEWDFASQNNLAVALAHAGQLEEALARLKTVEGTYPDHYFTAYNMGTVYELRGDLPSALEWTKKGIQRELNMTGHSPLDGTEWLHLRILETQVALKTTPDWLDSHSVSGLDFGTSRSISTPTQYPEGLDRKTLSFAQVRHSLFEQLRERLEFVPAPNPVVGSLLADMGNMVAIESQSSDEEEQATQQKDASELYKMAIEYQAPHTKLLQSRFNYYAGTPPYLLYSFFFSLGVIGVMYYTWQRYQAMKHEWEVQQAQFLETRPRFQTACIEWKDYDPYEPQDQQRPG